MRSNSELFGATITGYSEFFRNPMLAATIIDAGTTWIINIINEIICYERRICGRGDKSCGGNCDDEGRCEMAGNHGANLFLLKSRKSDLLR